ncbi:MAG: hypothetical protein WCV86_01895 [Patescibacteria group bacterium]|jgi:hypothetical protein
MTRTFALLLVLVSLVAPSFANAEEINILRVEHDGEYTTWLFHEKDGWNLNAITSTAGWAGLEIGPTFALGNLLVQPLAAVNYVGGEIQTWSVLPEVFLIYTDSTWDCQSWNLAAFSPDAKPTFTYRTYVVMNGIIPMVGIGAQVEGILQTGTDTRMIGGVLSYATSRGTLYSFLGKTREGSSFARIALVVPL